MRIVTKNEIWKGFFYYEVGYSGLSTLREVKFEINIIVDNNSFEGVSKDDESKGCFDKSIEVKGFFENNFISFILKYPYAYFRDEEDKIVIDKKLKHPDVNYYGEFDEDKKSYNGEWEMIYEVEELADGDVVEISSGSWELRKFKDDYNE